MRVAYRHEGLGRGKLRGRRLAENDRAHLAQGLNAGRIAAGMKSLPHGRALAGRHVLGLDDVLDADGHAVDGRESRVRAPTSLGLLGPGKRSLARDMHERIELGRERIKPGKTGAHLRHRRALTRDKARRERCIGAGTHG